MLASDPPAAHWPHEGAISFVDVSVVYRPGLPPAVVSFSAELRARERAAVVGRTGAGKSTLVPAALPWGWPYGMHPAAHDATRHVPVPPTPCAMHCAMCAAGARALPAHGVHSILTMDVRPAYCGRCSRSSG